MPSPVRLIQPQPMSQFDRDKMILGAADAGRMVVNTSTGELEQWTGSAWVVVQTGDVVDGGQF